MPGRMSNGQGSRTDGGATARCVGEPIRREEFSCNTVK